MNIQPGPTVYRDGKNVKDRAFLGQRPLTSRIKNFARAYNRGRKKRAVIRERLEKAMIMERTSDNGYWAGPWDDEDFCITEDNSDKRILGKRLVEEERPLNT